MVWFGCSVLFIVGALTCRVILRLLRGIEPILSDLHSTVQSWPEPIRAIAF